MEGIRINEKNLLRIEKKNTETAIERNKETVKRLSEIHEHGDFYKKQIQKINDKIIQDEKKINDIDSRILSVSAGTLDDELVNRRTVNNENANHKLDISRKKVKEKNEKKVEDKKNLDLDYKTFRKHEGLSEWAIKKETERFFFNCDSIPDYMRENLKEMPNNKGYIWKGITFYGLLPKENDNIILFEKARGGILKIHEISQNNHIIDEKQGKGQKKFVSNEKRIPVLTKEQLSCFF